MVRNSIRKFLASPLVEVVVRVLVVLGVVMGGVAWLQNRETTERTEELAKCVAAYNDANNARSKALTDAADQERAAERKADDAQAALFLSPVLAKTTPRTPAEQEQLLQLFRAYQTALSEQREERKAADDARRDHPIPDPPKQVCD